MSDSLLKAQRLCELGTALYLDQRYEDSAQAFRQMLAVRQHPLGWSNLARALRECGVFDEALAAIEQGRRCGAEPQLTADLMSICLKLGQPAAAIEEFNRSGRPQLPEAHFHLAVAHLTLGDWAAGWNEYESRWACQVSEPRNLTLPLWDGSSIEGQTILLWAEQGLGDAIQFVRYAADVQRRGARVIVEVRPPLVPLLKSARGIEQLVAYGQPLPPADCHAPLMSLPRILNTTPDTAARDVPYLSAESARANAWRNELGAVRGFKVGIAWQGNPRVHGDRFRSIPLDQFKPLAMVPGVSLISLQHGATAGALNAAPFQLLAIDGLDTDGAFLDTAAIMTSLDLVITSDTSIAHLAGALGVPCWVALSVGADWRWMLARADSPWYPSLRLYRQTTLGDWPPVFERMAADLQRQAADQKAN